MSGRLSAELLRNNPKLNELLKTEIASAVEKAGITIVEAPKVSINPVKPWDINYKEIDSGGVPLLHVYIEKIGLQSRSDSPTYRPFADVVYCLVLPPEKNDCAYSDRSYYGEGYTTEDYLVYPADVADQWSDEDDVFRRIGSVEPALHKAVVKIAGGISRNIIQHFGLTLGQQQEEKSSLPKETDRQLDK